jgi:hypothetical protein
MDTENILGAGIGIGKLGKWKLRLTGQNNIQISNERNTG